MNFVQNHSIKGLPLCDKINCVTIVLNKDTLLGFAETMVCVRWKDVKKKHHGLLHRDWKPPHAPEDQSHASMSNPSTIGMTLSISKESISNQIFLNVVPVRVYSKKSSVDTLAFFDQGPRPLCVMYCTFAREPWN